MSCGRNGAAKLRWTVCCREFLFVWRYRIPNLATMNSLQRISSLQQLKLHLVPILCSLCMAAGMLSCGESYFVHEQPAIPEPAGFPPVPFPSWNAPSQAKITLGRMLFYDAQLSVTGTVSCASCHKQSLGFSDDQSVSRGVRGENGSRNAPSIINTAYQASWFWDGRARTLEEQITSALTSAAEMDADTAKLHVYLEKSPVYPLLFRDAFGDRSPMSIERTVEAIATFCRALVSGNSRYDQYAMGNPNALSTDEKAGMNLFFSEKTKCASCHSGFNFSDNKYHSIALRAHYYDKGRALVTGRERDIGMFKTPTLRNVAVSGPYMNDGTFTRLEDIIEHYNKGGNPFIYKDTTLIRPLNLSEIEKYQLLVFLRSLTDDDFVQNPRFRNPLR